MLDKKLSRRDVLKLMGLATAGAFLAACGTPEPTNQNLMSEEYDRYDARAEGIPCHHDVQL